MNAIPANWKDSSNPKYLLLLGRAYFESGRFSDSLTSTCKYINTLNSLSPQTLSLSAQLYFARLELAGFIAETSRNINELSGDERLEFIAQYLNQCDSVLGKNTIVKNLLISSYLNEDNSLINDAILILQNSPVEADISNIPQIRAKYLATRWFYENATNQTSLALSTARDAVNLYENSGEDEYLFHLYGILGTSLINLNKYAEARYYFARKLEIAKRYYPIYAQSDAYFSLGFTYQKLGEYAAARRYFERALSIDSSKEKNEFGDSKECPYNSIYSAQSLINIGSLDRTIGNSERALQEHQCALEILKGSNEYYEIYAYLELALDYLVIGDDAQAKFFAELALSDERILSQQKLDGLITLLQVAVNNKDIAKSMAYVEQIDHELNVNSETEKDATFSSRRIQKYALLIKLIRVTAVDSGIDDYADRAFTILQDAKQSLRFEDSWAWLAAQQHLLNEYIYALFVLNDNADNANYQKIFSVLERFSTANFSEHKYMNSICDFRNEARGNSNSYCENLFRATETVAFSEKEKKKDAITELDSVSNSVDAQMMFEASLKDHVNSSPPLLNILQLQKNMRNEDIFIRCFVNESASLSIVITKDEWYLRNLPSHRELEKAFNMLDADISNNNIAAGMKKTLLNQLLPLKHLRKEELSKLIIVTDNILHRIPFSALNIANTNEPYKPLAEKLRIVRAPAASIYFSGPIAVNDLTSSELDIAIFADPAFSSNPQLSLNETPASSSNFRSWERSLTRLPFTASEAENISNLFSHLGHNLQVSTGLNATSEWLMKDETRNAKILHIATHGYFDHEYPELVGIATSIDSASAVAPGFLSLSELLSAPFHSRLIIVSGCETMLGKNYSSVGTKSMTAGLLSRGAGSVIGTLWKIADRPTSIFMKYFYEALKDNGGDSSKALYRARNKMASTGRYKDPIYWAGFVLTSSNDSFVRNVFN